MNQTFNDLGLVTPISNVLEKNNYTTPTPIQLSAIPLLLKKNDLLAIAQTGTGKTAAFALPLLQHLFQSQCNPKPRTVRALVLAPTRELVIQIADNCKIYGENLSLRQTTIFGGVSEVPQIKTMSRGVDLLIATPGRLLDLIEQNHVDLSHVAYLVLDEADRMLDMGFIRDIKKIIAKIPKQRQTMLFSATMPESISGLANSILINPKTVSITPKVITVEKITQSVYLIDKKDKRALLVTLLKDQKLNKVIVFSKTKHGANRIVQELDHANISSAAIHGNKSQSARQKALTSFREDDIRVLVATDIAARGIDVDNITHVINYDLPNEPESYVHRIGRTARAGAGGIAFAFCDETERNLLRDIEKTIKFKLTVTPTPVLEKMSPLAASNERPPLNNNAGRSNNRNSQSKNKEGAAHSNFNRNRNPKSSNQRSNNRRSSTAANR
jgi:ATP-dependent RNA helicase RhlE